MRHDLLPATAFLLILLAAMPATAGMIQYVETWSIDSSPFGVDVDSAGNVYVAHHSATNVKKYSSSGDLQSVTYLSGNSPIDVAVGPSGYVYAVPPFVDASSKFWLKKYANEGGEPVATWELPRGTWGVTTDSAGNVYAVDNSQTLTRYDSSGGSATTIATGIGGYTSLALNADETVAYVVGSGKLCQVDLATGTATTFASLAGGDQYGSVAVDTMTGNIYVAERSASSGNYRNVVEVFASDGTLIQRWNTWDPGTGEVSYSTSGSSFSRCFGVAFDTNSGRIYVTDMGSAKCIVFQSVPEPSTVIMLSWIIPLGMLACARRRRKETRCEG